MEEVDTDVFFVLPEGRQFVILEGVGKCLPVPSGPMRVWFQRTATGNGAIYLFHTKPAKRVTSQYAAQAFGWIAEWASHRIWLPKGEGWCNFWHENSTEALQIEGISFSSDRPADNHYIEFTDELDGLYLCGPTAMRDLGRVTNHRRQNQHWRTPATIAKAVLIAHPSSSDRPLQLSKETPVGSSFDPYSAASEQQARLAASASKQGKSVNNVKQACSNALATVAENNKSAAVDAGYLTAGTIANNQFSKLAGKHLPMMVRGYADTPFGKLVLANVAQQAVQHFKPGNKTALRLTDAMMTSAMAEVIGSTGIEELIDGFLSDPKIAKALTTVGDAAD